MFKIIALVGVVAGGAAYGLYTHSECGGITCPLAGKACCSGDAEKPATPSCCANPCPSCAASCDGCPVCETDCSACCTSAAVAISASTAKPKISSCCAGSACCETSSSAKAAVAGSAAVLIGAAK